MNNTNTVSETTLIGVTLALLAGWSLFSVQSGMPAGSMACSGAALLGLHALLWKF